MNECQSYYVTLISYLHQFDKLYYFFLCLSVCLYLSLSLCQAARALWESRHGPSRQINRSLSANDCDILLKEDPTFSDFARGQNEDGNDVNDGTKLA